MQVPLFFPLISCNNACSGAIALASLVACFVCFLGTVVCMRMLVPATSSVGGMASLGYFSCAWSPDGGSLVAHGFTGALHLWQQKQVRVFLCAQHQHTCKTHCITCHQPPLIVLADMVKVYAVVNAAVNTAFMIPPQNVWGPHHACGGHYGAVTDATWAFSGALEKPNGPDSHNMPLPGCLVTVSADMTTRLAVQANGRMWELARPQIHGHALRCVAALPASATRGCVFASGSEEKVLRVLEAPSAFLQSWAFAVGAAPAVEVPVHHTPITIHACYLIACCCKTNCCMGFHRPWLQLQQAPHRVCTIQGAARGALVSALGLSNQALFDQDLEGGTGCHLPQHTVEGPDIAPHAAPQVLTGACVCVSVVVCAKPVGKIIISTSRVAMYYSLPWITAQSHGSQKESGFRLMSIIGWYNRAAPGRDIESIDSMARNPQAVRTRQRPLCTGRGPPGAVLCQQLQGSKRFNCLTVDMGHCTVRIKRLCFFILQDDFSLRDVLLFFVLYAFSFLFRTSFFLQFILCYSSCVVVRTASKHYLHTLNVHRWTAAAPPVEAASLTVTRIVFSPCGGWLLCSSRDRSLTLLQRGVAGAPLTVRHRLLKVNLDDLHTRGDGCSG